MSDAPKLPKGLPVESFDPGDLVYTAKDMEDFRAAGERAARAAAFDDAIAACGAEAAGFRENRLWEAVAGIQACIDALRRGGREGAGEDRRTARQAGREGEVMRVNLGDPPPRFTEGVTVGDIYPAKGGRGDTRFWLVVSLGHTGRTAHCLGLNADGEVVSTCSYSAYVFTERPRIGWCAEVRDWTPAVEWEVTQ